MIIDPDGDEEIGKLFEYLAWLGNPAYQAGVTLSSLSIIVLLSSKLTTLPL